MKYEAAFNLGETICAVLKLTDERVCIGVRPEQVIVWDLDGEAEHPLAWASNEGDDYRLVKQFLVLPVSVRQVPEAHKTIFDWDDASLDVSNATMRVDLLETAQSERAYRESLGIPARNNLAWVIEERRNT